MPNADFLTEPVIPHHPSLEGTPTAYGLSSSGPQSSSGGGSDLLGFADDANLENLLQVYSPNPGDFTGNGLGDILWHNPVTRQSVVGSPDSDLIIDPIFEDPNWQLVGLGDFDGDRHTDLLLRNPVTGETGLGFLEDTQLREHHILKLKIAAPWELVTTIDLNQDGKDDLLWQHPATGQLVSWRMDGSNIMGSNALPNVRDRAWKLVGSGNFTQAVTAESGASNSSPEDSDLETTGTDLVWSNAETGETVLWTMVQGRRQQITSLQRQENQNQVLVGVLDADGDNDPDLLWQDVETGTPTLWNMNGRARQSTVTIEGVADARISTAEKTLLWRPMGLSRSPRAQTIQPTEPSETNTAETSQEVPPPKEEPTPPTESVQAKQPIVEETAPITETSTEPTPIDDWFSQQLLDSELVAIARDRFQDGRIDRNDMIAILTSAGSDDAQVDTQEFADLQTIVSSATELKLDDYVRALADNVVNGDPANQWFTGGAQQRQELGNLQIGSGAEQLNQLIDKWFLGGDRPSPMSNSHNYQYIQGSLFQDGISLADVQQAQLGNCYYLAVLGSIAHEQPQVIQDIFIDNGDGTFTVRFFNGRRAEYVTVDRYLPTLANGQSPSAQFGNGPNDISNELWVALAEKAYAQLSESNWIGQDAVNSYAAIEGGWTSKPTKHILSHSTSTKHASSLDINDVINWIDSDAVLTVNVIGEGDYGIIDNHAYSLTDYDPATQTFHLHNPWGSHHADVTLEQLSNLQAYLVRSFKR